MQPKLSNRSLLIVAIVSCLLYTVFLFYFIPKDPAQSNSALFIENTDILPIQEHPDYGLPVILKIPSIDVDSTVEQVGLTSDGAMDVPKTRDNVAWFSLGSRPGEVGSAVMAGHYGIKDGKGSVFDNLHKLNKGDKLYIEDEKGIITTFVVRESRRFDSQADATKVFGSNDGESHLNLVTCEGIWDEASGGYTQRLVVFTDKK